MCAKGVNYNHVLMEVTLTCHDGLTAELHYVSNNHHSVSQVVLIN